MIKKILAVPLLISLVGLTSLFAQEQSLAELARKEKERRENLKSRQTKVITNKDLENLQKSPAIIIKGQETTSSPESQTTTFPQSTSTSSVVHRVTVAEPSGGTSSYQPSGTAEPRTSFMDKEGSSLENAWKKAQEYVELLTLKMNSLWQEFYSLDDMTSRDHIQKQISETYEKLLKAQEEESRLRAEYEKQINQKKSEGANPLWIR